MKSQQTFEQVSLIKKIIPSWGKNKNILKLATVFSGIGAIEQALQKIKVPHKIIFACDNDKFVKESYFANYNFNAWYDDVNDINGHYFKNKIDLFVGGSPCQSFSHLGNRQGINDLRGFLIYEFIRLVDEMKPKMFIFENVKGLLTHNGGAHEK